MHPRSTSSPPAPPVVPPPLPHELSSAQRPQPIAGSPPSPPRWQHLPAPLVVTVCLLIGAVCLVVRQRGWMPTVDSAASGVDWSSQRPGLDQLTGVTLSIRSDSVGLASRDVTPDDAVAKIAATRPRFESPTVSGAVPDASPPATDAVQPNTSIDEIVSPRQQRHQHESPQHQASPLQATVAADQNSTTSVAKSANHPLRSASELLWGIPDPARPESLMKLASPTSLLHATPENETCAASEMATLATALEWADKPADAYRMAAEQQKLVFLIHVSGNFEIPGYT